MKYSGGCHCGNIRIEFETGIDPGAIEVRTCQCSFCRKHGSRAVADPAGRLVVRVEREALLQRYSFGLETADYLICRRCGVYVAAVAAGEPEPRGIAIVNCLEDQHLFSRTPIAISYDVENIDERKARRRQRWTPTTFR